MDKHSFSTLSEAVNTLTQEEGYKEDFEAFESEDTLSILNRYVEEAEEVDLDKSKIKKILDSVYKEACELI